jgi:hypothetical protein
VPQQQTIAFQCAQRLGEHALESRH